MTDYIPNFELLALIAFLAGFVALLTGLALRDWRGFLLMVRDSEAFARQPCPAEDTATVKDTAEALPVRPAIAAE